MELAFPILEGSAITSQPAKQAWSQWSEIWRNAAHSPALYSPLWTEYFEAYVSSPQHPAQSLAQVIFHHAEPIGIWPLYGYHAEGKFGLGSCAERVTPPIFKPGIGKKTIEETIAWAIHGLGKLCQTFGMEYWEGEETAFGPLSLWHQALMAAGAAATVEHDLYVDLEPSLDVIRSLFRRTAKKGINQGMRLWKTEVHDGARAEVLEELRLLHMAVAGRETRPRLTWDLQRQAIEKGEAFLVAIRDDQSRLVGGALFANSPQSASYAVAAYDRTLFDKPLGHVAQMAAITHMKEKGIRWYKLGNRPYRTTVPGVTEKVLSIAHFKEHFATHYFPRLVTRLCASSG